MNTTTREENINNRRGAVYAISHLSSFCKKRMLGREQVCSLVLDPFPQKKNSQSALSIITQGISEEGNRKKSVDKGKRVNYRGDADKESERG